MPDGFKVTDNRRWTKSGIAPLVEVCRDELGDRRLNPEEAVYREREELLSMTAKRRIGGQDELEDPERSCGPRLHFSTIIHKLQSISPALKVLDGIPGNVAMYYPRRKDELDEEDRDFTKDEFFFDHKYVTGMPKEYIPEYSHVLLDSSNLPTREVRGWRTVLIALIKAGAVSYRGAVREFGEPKGERSLLWRKQLQNYRN